MRGEGWAYLVGGLALAGLLLHEALLVVLALMLLLVMLLSSAWDHFCLAGLSYRRTLSQTRAFPGEELTLGLEVTNAKPLPLAWLEIEDGVPGQHVELLPGPTRPSATPGRRTLSLLTSTRGYERVRRHYRLRCLARGYVAFGPATLRSGDVFGFTSRELHVHHEDYLLVYPKIVPLERLGLPAGDPFGDVPLRQQWLFEDPLRSIGVREYRPGDNPRRLHWKATARAPGQTLQVKQYEPTTSHRVLVLLNVTTADHNWSWAGYDPEVLEAAITVAASVANWASERGVPFGLRANTNLYRSGSAARIPPGRDPRQLVYVLEALARLVPMASMAPQSLVELASRELSYGTTVVLVTGMLNDALVRQLRRLRGAGHRPAVLLISTTDEPMARLDGLPAYAIHVEDTR